MQGPLITNANMVNAAMEIVAMDTLEAKLSVWLKPAAWGHGQSTSSAEGARHGNHGNACPHSSRVARMPGGNCCSDQGSIRVEVAAFDRAARSRNVPP
jgi:hypothetical protein